MADGNTVVWTHGSQFYDATVKVAKETPDVTFIAEQDTQPADVPKNVWVLDRNFHLAFYPLGVLAGATTKTGKIAYLGGATLPFSYSEVHAVEQALKDSGSSATLTSVWTGDFNDPAKAQQFTSQLVAGGNDVILGSLNLGMVGAFEGVKSEGSGTTLMTAKYTDKSKLAPENYVTSVIYDFSVMLDEILTQVEDGKTGGYLGMDYDKGISVQEPANVDPRGRRSRRQGGRGPEERHDRGRARRHPDRMTARPDPTVPPLRMSGVSKSFGPVKALVDVDFELAAGEVHGLVGGNGAGKTTLMNVLYGLYRPDAGEIRDDGEEVHVRSPRDAMALGIGMVHQHLLQVPVYSVAENVVLGTSGVGRPAAGRPADHRDLRPVRARGRPAGPDRPAVGRAPASGWRSSRSSTAARGS